MIEVGAFGNVKKFQSAVFDLVPVGTDIGKFKILSAGPVYRAVLILGAADEEMICFAVRCAVHKQKNGIGAVGSDSVF